MTALESIRHAPAPQPVRSGPLPLLSSCAVEGAAGFCGVETSRTICSSVGRMRCPADCTPPRRCRDDCDFGLANGDARVPTRSRSQLLARPGMSQVACSSGNTVAEPCELRHGTRSCSAFVDITVAPPGAFWLLKRATEPAEHRATPAIFDGVCLKWNDCHLHRVQVPIYPSRYLRCRYFGAAPNLLFYSRNQRYVPLIQKRLCR